MCVIIHRKPGITIPFGKLSSACTVNAEGMGIVTVDRGKMSLRKYFWEKGNDPEVLAKQLEDNIDCDTYVHLRYRTKGNADSANVHPFPVVGQKKHGFDIQFMHNGTLSDYGTDTQCDSKHFTKKFLTPLAERFLRSLEPNDLLLDPMFNDIVSKYAGVSSVFLLADNFGNHTIINRQRGKDFDGWWASNEYSFDRYHREPTTTYYRDMSWERDSVQGAEKKVVTLPKLPPSNTTSDTGSTKPFNDEVPWKEEKEKVVASPVFPNRETFLELAGLKSLSEVCGLTDENIKDMVDDEPEMAALLILDLLAELYNRDQEYNDYADSLADQADKEVA